MIAYKLLKQRKDGTLGPLFINRKQKLKLHQYYEAEEHPTKGFAFRPGWHVCKEMKAPHLSTKGRVWAKVDIEGYTKHKRPEHQGGVWYTAKYMAIIEIINHV